MKSKNTRHRIIAFILMTILVIGSVAAGDGNVLYAQAAGRPVAISSCQISGTEVVCQLEASSVPSSDDGLLHLLKIKFLQR